MPDPVPGSPEHAANMLAKARGITYEEALKQFKTADGASAAAAAGDKPVRPEHIPEKFWDAEKGVVNYDAMARSYTELERKQSGAVTTTETTSAVTPPATGLPTIEQPNAAPPVDKQAAFKSASEKASAEYLKDGKLSDESYKALADLGYERPIVDAFVAGQKALQDQYVSALHTAAGGKDSYDQMIAWARTNLKPDQARGFDAVLRGGNIEATKIAVAGLKARFEATVGKSPTTTVTPTNVDAASAQPGFTSRAEMVAAMADKRYQKGDPQYQAEVRNKIAAAIRNKVDLGLSVIQTRA